MMPPRTSMGIAATSFLTALRPTDPLAYLDYCHSLGAGGIQIGLFKLDAAGRRTLRERAEQYGMFVEVMAPLPGENIEEFRQAIRNAKEAGATVVRAGCLSGRRYETFNTLADWQTFVAASHKKIQAALPILEQEKVAMGLENHKDWTREEFLKILETYRSEYFGVTIDTGNNIALLDDPYAIVEALAPHAVTTHIKDMAWDEAPQGFVMAEVPLGEGSLDMRRIIDTIHRARPKARMLLETITRDPLNIPCLTPKYWVTFGDRKAADLANTLAMVRTKKANLPMARTSGKDHRTVVRMEEDAVRISLAYARTQLGLTLQ
jgi:sugar phosphate isomerase/epimerase